MLASPRPASARATSSDCFTCAALPSNWMSAMAVSKSVQWSFGSRAIAARSRRRYASSKNSTRRTRRCVARSRLAFSRFTTNQPAMATSAAMRIGGRLDHVMMITSVTCSCGKDPQLRDARRVRPGAAGKRRDVAVDCPVRPEILARAAPPPAPPSSPTALDADPKIRPRCARRGLARRRRVDERAPGRLSAARCRRVLRGPHRRRMTHTRACSARSAGRRFGVVAPAARFFA